MVNKTHKSSSHFAFRETFPRRRDMALFFTKLSEKLLVSFSEATKYVEHTIWQVEFQNVQEQKGWEVYIKDSAKGIVYLAKGNKLPQPQLASEDTVANEKSQWDESSKQQYDSKVECFFRAAEKGLKAALQENETVELERFTYLETPFKSFPKYTPVFLRRTNLAEYCLIVTGYIVRCSQAKNQDQTQQGSELIFYKVPTPTPSAMTRGGITSIAKSLAQGLLSGAAGRVGVLIFDAIFPPGMPDYFDAVYAEIEKIVHQDLTENTIAEVNGQVNGLKNWVATTYTNAKESGTLSKKELTQLIQPREPQIAIELLGTLMDERFAKAGVCVFMIAAGMHLSILQELAFVDPNAASPGKSHYVKSIQDYATKYANHASTTTNAIITSRLGMIKRTDNNEYIDGTRYYFYSFRDHFTGHYESWTKYCDTKGCHKTDSHAKREEAMRKYSEDTKRALIGKMQDPVATANEWLKLKTQPLP